MNKKNLMYHLIPPRVPQLENRFSELDLRIRKINEKENIINMRL